MSGANFKHRSVKIFLLSTWSECQDFGEKFHGELNKFSWSKMHSRQHNPFDLNLEGNESRGLKNEYQTSKRIE